MPCGTDFLVCHQTDWTSELACQVGPTFPGIASMKTARRNVPAGRCVCLDPSPGLPSGRSYHGDCGTTTAATINHSAHGCHLTNRNRMPRTKKLGVCEHFQRSVPQHINQGSYGIGLSLSTPYYLQPCAIPRPGHLLATSSHPTRVAYPDVPGSGAGSWA